MGNSDEDISHWEMVNHTELLQRCIEAGLPVSPKMNRYELIRLIAGVTEPDERAHNKLNELRDALMQFIIAHWKALQAQLTCPAKDKDPKACYQCLDAQISHCIATNAGYKAKIESHRVRKV